jgi:DNA-directed RNA polymerase subunit beta
MLFTKKKFIFTKFCFEVSFQQKKSDFSLTTFLLTWKDFLFLYNKTNQKENEKFCCKKKIDFFFKDFVFSKKTFCLQYNLESYGRSNQDTCLINKPAVKEGDWIQQGDILADSASSLAGDLSLGRNIFLAYMPWEGYNYEDAILISENLVYDDVYTSIHIEKYEVHTNFLSYGTEQISRLVPDIKDEQIQHLDFQGIAKIGSWLKEGDIIVGKRTPMESKKRYTNYERLFRDILQYESESSFLDNSLRMPKGSEGKILYVQILRTKSYASSFKNKKILKKKEMLITSILDSQTPQGQIQKDKQKWKIQYTTQRSSFKNQEKTFIQNKTTNYAKGFIEKDKLTKKLLNFFVKNSISIKQKMKNACSVNVYIAEKRKIQMGDKMSGRHGNKGIISKIIPRQDMPYLPDGTCIHMILNPLGVPSRMNVGQIYECLLGLAGKYLGEQYKILPFDESYGSEASRSFVFNQLNKARSITGQQWLFQPNHPGKIKIMDGRTGDCFHQAVTVGSSYILKLIHLVDDKIHSRSTGPYSLITQQPLRGRSKQGGQRLGEMEVWALEAYGAAFTLLELLTIKSDDVVGRLTIWDSLLYQSSLTMGTPASFKVLICELQALCLNIGIFKENISI